MIALDTSALIDLSEAETPGHRNAALGRRARKYLERADEAGRVVALPAAVVAEYQAKLTDEEAAVARDVLARTYVVLPLDDAAANNAGEIFRASNWKAEITPEQPRQCVKTDVYVIGTAVAHGVLELLTNDPHFEKLASGRIKIVLISNLPATLLDELGDA